MYSLLILTVTSHLTTTAFARIVCCKTTDYDYGCTKNYNDKNLPTPKCPHEIPSVFKLYTRDNRREPQDLLKDYVPSHYSSTRTLDIFLVHGYLGDWDSEYNFLLKDALLDRGNFNVIVVGWSNGAGDRKYKRAVANSFTVALELKAVAKKLVSVGSSQARLYCVGASLGAHLCGNTGNEFTFGRITGLDPAGPLFEGYNRGLNKGNAAFVDVIHTDGKGKGKYGTLVPLGDADFYPNGGANQPGCFILCRNLCSHIRAVQYYLFSVKEDCFIATNKCSDPEKVKDNCPIAPPSVMGFGANFLHTGLYYVPIKRRKPYCEK